jgi:hypothetical protein
MMHGLHFVWWDRHMMFYTIGIPLTEVLNAQGIPALLRFVDDRHTCVRTCPLKAAQRAVILANSGACCHPCELWRIPSQV